MSSRADTKVENATGVVRFRCIQCGHESDKAAQSFRCSACGDLLEIRLPWSADSMSFSTTKLKETWRSRLLSREVRDQSGVWRFRELLPPVETGEIITLREGNTPLYELPRSAAAAGVESLLAKHQGMNPTGSFKDLGMTVAISIAHQEGFSWVACASTGNTSASMAAYAAHSGLRSLVLVPEERIAWGKLSQALDYGAVTCQLRTDFDGCVQVLSEVVQSHPVYVLNSINPYRIEGQKTAAFELMEQLNWQVPEHVIVPGGNLGNSSALGKGFVELRELGFIGNLPKISIIQAEGANALLRTMRETNGKRLVSVQAETSATAICIGSPLSWKKAVRVLECTGGTCEQVSEVEIALAKSEIGADGVGCEPASAVTLAGLKKLVARGFVKRKERVVLILTGHVLKDPDYTIRFHRGDLPASATAPEKDSLAAHRRAPVNLEADATAVLRVLEDVERTVARS